MAQLADLVRWEATAPRVLAGDHLVHGDLRSDNIMIAEHHQVWFIDWPHASVGAPWLDLAFMLPSIAAEGGGPAAELFAAQPVAAQVPADDLRAALGGLAGYFAWQSLQPDPRGIPNLRTYQLAQARATLHWLHSLA
jgi:aminoglycoside phosphotransferase (APT) family kinase protein